MWRRGRLPPWASCESPSGQSVAQLFGRRFAGVGLLASVAARFRLDGERIRRDLSVVTLVGGFCHTSLLLRIRSTSPSLFPSEPRPAACSTSRSSYMPMPPAWSPRSKPTAQQEGPRHLGCAQHPAVLPSLVTLGFHSPISMRTRKVPNQATFNTLGQCPSPT